MGLVLSWEKLIEDLIIIVGAVTWCKWDIEDFIQAIPVDQGKNHIRYFWQCLETVKKIMRAHSNEEKTIYSGTVIIDMDGLAITQFASREGNLPKNLKKVHKTKKLKFFFAVIEVVLEATRQYEANYPGFLKKQLWSTRRKSLPFCTKFCVHF